MLNRLKGSLMVISAAFFWGISGTIARMLFISNVDPFKIVNMRINIAFFALLIYVLIFDRDIMKIKKEDLKHLVILGIFGIVGIQTTYYYTISVLNVSMAIFLQYLAPIIVVIYCVVFQGEKMTNKKVLSLVLAMIGGSLIVFGKEAGMILLPLGIATGVLSGIFNAFYIIYTKKLANDYKPWTILLFAFGTAALIYGFIKPPWTLWSQVTAHELFYVLFLSIFATIVPFGLYISGIKYMQPTTASILSLLEPVVATVSAFFLVGETMTLKQVFGASLVLASILILQVFVEHNNIVE